MKFVFSASPWDGGGDGVVSIRPADSKPWEDIPIGPAMMISEVRIVKRWLEGGGWAELAKIGNNIGGNIE